MAPLSVTLSDLERSIQVPTFEESRMSSHVLFGFSYDAVF